MLNLCSKKYSQRYLNKKCFSLFMQDNYVLILSHFSLYIQYRVALMHLTTTTTTTKIDLVHKTYLHFKISELSFTIHKIAKVKTD